MRKHPPRSPDDAIFDSEDRDHPLVLRYKPEEDWLNLALPPAPPRHQQARAQIAAIALDKVRHRQPWISYSRNRNHYSRRGRRYDERPELYRFSIIPRAVDEFAGAGYVYSVVAPPDPRCGQQSVFCATPVLIAALGAAPPPLAKPKARELVQLRDEQKQLIDFRDTERTTRMRRRLVEINEATGGLKIELPAGIGERYGDVLTIGNSCINLGNTVLRRIFNIDFRNGGRMYGHWTQGVPRALRPGLTINGEPVAEPDYPAHHLRILYARAGIALHGDPYDIDDWDRDIAKRGVLILINALTWSSAIGAIMDRYGISLKEAAWLVKDIKRRHKPIEAYFHSGVGLCLQRIDSDMAERVMLGLIHRGDPALPIHDSFIVPARHEGAAREQMDEAFETVILRECGVSRITKLDQQLKIKSTYTMVTSSSLPLPVPSVVHLPLSSFGVSAFFGAGRRITPLGRIAALDAKRRRNIRQDTLADLVGISRPTLANILAGRFGASPQTAERISEVIALTPVFERQPFLPGLAA